MSSLNRAILIGNLTRDPEVRSTQAGKQVCNIGIATNQTWKDGQTGERRERTEYHRVVIFTPALIDLVQRFLRRGSKVYVEGELQTRKWEKDGIERQATEIVLQGFAGKIVFLDKAGGGQVAGGRPDDDEIPF